MLRNEEFVRAKKYKPDKFIEDILLKANNSLSVVEEKITKKLPMSRQPILFFAFAPRSGSTLLSQLLAKTGRFNYISNFLARFWRAPYIGGLFERELNLRKSYSNVTFHSDYGLTKENIEPHEFGFFWNYWLPVGTTTAIPEKNIIKVNKKGLVREVNAIQNIYDKPLFLRNSIASMNVGFLAKVFPNSFFIIIKRQYPYMAQSIYQMRKNYLGDINKWVSIRPLAYHKLRKRNVYTQIAGQVIEIYREIEDQLINIPKRVLIIQYEDLCARPKENINKIFKLMKRKPQGFWYKNMPKKLKNTNRKQLSDRIFDQLKKAIENYSEEKI